MDIGIVGIAMFFNFATIYVKFNNDRVMEAILDGGVFVAIMYITAMAGQGGMYAGTVASALFSIFLYFNPPKFFQEESDDTTVSTRNSN